MNLFSLCIACAFLLSLLNINFVWLIFKKMFEISGCTYKQMLSDLKNDIPSSTRSGRALGERIFLGYLLQTSGNADATKKLFRLFESATALPIFPFMVIVLSFTIFQSVKTVFLPIGISVIAVTDIVFTVLYFYYKKCYPLSSFAIDRIEENLAYERIVNHKSKITRILKNTALAVVMIVFAVQINNYIFKLSADENYNNSQIQYSYKDLDYNTVIEALASENYDIESRAVSYKFIDTQKLKCSACGIKDDIVFEFYQYTDDETVDLVYDQLCFNVLRCANSDNYEETDISYNGKMFTFSNEGITYIVVYKNNTVVFSFEPEGSDEIINLLYKIGYLEYDE